MPGKPGYEGNGSELAETREGTEDDGQNCELAHRPPFSLKTAMTILPK